MNDNGKQPEKNRNCLKIFIKIKKGKVATLVLYLTVI